MYQAIVVLLRLLSSFKPTSKWMKSYSTTKRNVNKQINKQSKQDKTVKNSFFRKRMKPWLILNSF